ncbi:MAG TPA: serine/threonine-protein kinase [Polyangia bacterium]
MADRRTGDPDGKDVLAATALAAGPAHAAKASPPLADTLAASPADRAAAGSSVVETGTQVGRLVVLNKLGEGGTAVLYVAYDRELDRKVALKFMRPNPQHSRSEKLTAARARLMREAQALARLNHPNVVAVHDVGTFGEQVFIAESFVDGADLRVWAQMHPRTLREILAVFAQAGRGLAAAHAAGLVHRDFKPENVLIGHDGRVQVTDFGLARAAGEVPVIEPIQALGATLADSAGLLSTPLTQTGTLMGTPAYMAPEQHLGQAADVRTDQFNFCVSLYELLYGERPFIGETVGELARQVTQGKVRPAPKDTRVPAWLRRVVLRGLRPDPAERYPSMDVLLDALGHDPAARWRRAGAVLGLVALVAAVAAGVTVYHARGARLCQGADRKLAGVWDAGRKETIRLAFVATGKPYAAAAFEGVSRVLDAHTRAWVAMHEDACAATRVRGEQSEALLDLRMACLGQRLEEVKALGDVLAAADAKTVERAASAAGAVSPLAVCGDAEALKGVLPPPRDAATQVRVKEVRAKLAQAKALDEAGRYEQGMTVAAAADAEAQAVGYRPLEAEARLRLAAATLSKGDYKLAEQRLHEALWLAMEGKHHEIETRAAVSLTNTVGYLQKRTTEGHFWARHARAALTAYGADPALEAAWHNGSAGVFAAEAKYDRQLEHNLKALELRQRAFGPTHAAVAGSLNNLGVTFSSKGDNARAADYFQRALTTNEKVSGPDHPDVALACMNLAETVGALGDFERQRQLAERAVRLFTAATGPEHPYVAASTLALGNALHNQGQHAEALARFVRGQAIYEKAVGPKDADFAQALASVGREQRCLDPRSPAALEAGRRAVAILEAAVGRDHPDLAAALTLVGQAQLALGAPHEAIAPLERAVPLRIKGGAAADDLAETRFALAQALWQAGRDRARAVTLATAARDGLKPLKFRAAELQQVEAWLKQHGG